MTLRKKREALFLAQEKKEKQVSSSKEDLSFYESFVQQMAREKSERVFNNHGFGCAQIVLGELFKNADSKVRIYSKSMEDKITSSSSYMDNMITFLEKKDTRLEIIIEDLTSFKDSLIRYILFNPKYKDKVTIKHSSEEVVFKRNNKPVHFTTGDEKMFRLEFDIENNKAECSFNSEKRTEKMNTLFNDAFKDKYLKEVTEEDLKDKVK